MIQKYTIGRNPNNHIVITHPAVSGYHADLIVDDSMGYPQYTFVDHSTNGTMINGQFLKHASCFVVYNDSIILAGAVLFDWGTIGASNIYSSGTSPVVNPASGSSSLNRREISFGGALRSYFDNYVNFKGRATRREYWFVYLWLLIFSSFLSFLSIPSMLSLYGSIFAVDFEDFLAPAIYGFGWVFYLWMVYGLVTFLPSLSLLVRRIHDTGKDGLWILMLLVPVVNVVFFFIWTLSPSEPRANKWGRY